jgi:hypothetical protein
MSSNNLPAKSGQNCSISLGHVSFDLNPLSPDQSSSLTTYMAKKVIDLNYATALMNSEIAVLDTALDTMSGGLQKAKDNGISITVEKTFHTDMGTTKITGHSRSIRNWFK